jgi:hypothetical protein
MSPSERWTVNTKMLVLPGLLSLVISASFAALLYFSRTAAAAPVIVTEQGPLRGLTVSGENEYLGIPYAAPPVGSLRWLPSSLQRTSREYFRQPSSETSVRKILNFLRDLRLATRTACI